MFRVTDLLGGTYIFGNTNDEDSLIAVIKELTNIAVNYGIPCLELMIIPDLVAGRQLREELYENHFDRAKEFARIYELRVVYVSYLGRRLKE